MTRIALLPLALVALLVSAPVASAQLPGQGLAKGVELVRNIETGPTSGARLLDGYYYVTTGRNLQIFDTNKDPENPQLVGSVNYPSPGPAEQRAPHEDPDTNGRILVSAANGDLLVFDVTDKAAPKIAGTLDGGAQHTVSCVLDCNYVYGSDGLIADLTDPKNPKDAGLWTDASGVGGSHDVTEVRPGIVVTSSRPITLLDLRKDPLKPTVMAQAESPGFVHANLWPHQMRDDFLLVGGEGSTAACPDGPDSTFYTMDTRGWQTTKTFKLISEFRMSRTDPNSPGAPQTSFCVHWFDTQPQYVNGGLVAIGWYESGLRFLKVGTDGSLEEVGYWLPAGTRASAAYWRTERILYTADYYRGVDVLRWTDDIPGGRPLAPAGSPPPSAPPSGPPTPPKRAVSFDDLVRMPSSRRCVRAKTFGPVAKRNASDPVTSLRLFVKGKLKKAARGKALRKRVRLRSLPRGRFTLQVEVRTRSGHKTASQRSYRRCAR